MDIILSVKLYDEALDLFHRDLVMTYYGGILVVLPQTLDNHRLEE
jgi:hypothetical protein